MSEFLRGVERERELDRESYYSDEYFDMPQLYSFVRQSIF
jgi:hypothetical protein